MPLGGSGTPPSPRTAAAPVSTQTQDALEAPHRHHFGVCLAHFEAVGVVLGSDLGDKRSTSEVQVVSPRRDSCQHLDACAWRLLRVRPHSGVERGEVAVQIGEEDVALFQGPVARRQHRERLLDNRHVGCEPFVRLLELWKRLWPLGQDAEVLALHEAFTSGLVLTPAANGPLNN